jgi:hypothetical protein
MPGKAEALWVQLGAPGSANGMLFSDVESVNPAGWHVSKGAGLFPRPEPRPAA